VTDEPRPTRAAYATRVIHPTHLTLPTHLTYLTHLTYTTDSTHQYVPLITLCALFSSLIAAER
jgi:hypothetical protein